MSSNIDNFSTLNYLTSGGFIPKSTTGLMNRTHLLSIVMELVLVDQRS